mgnify:FL=1|jgi:hypothetical protein
MNSRTLAIYDTESGYAKGLLQYINGKQNIPFKTVCFTNRELLVEYLENNNPDILLIAAEEMSMEIDKSSAKKIIILSKGSIPFDYSEYTSIYKYQSMESIIRSILEILADDCQKQDFLEPERDRAKIIGVYSPINGAGQTTFAITLGEVLAQRERTLYVSMKEFSAINKLTGERSQGDLSDLMYFYRQNPQSVSIKLQAVIDNIHGLDYVPPLTFFQDLRNIESKQWADLIEKMALSGLYEIIIVDLGSVLSNIFQILDICDTIYTVIREDIISKAKMDNYEEFLLRNDNDSILQKTIKIKLPAIDEAENMGEFFEKQLWGKIGDYAREISKNVAW